MLTKKRIPYLPLFISILVFIYFSSGIPFAQEKKSEEPEPHHIQMLKQFKMKIEGWLKDINERIESEDVTRFEVRFLEILRSILEWVRDKMDDWIQSETAKSKRKGRMEDI
jgi:hypothetical protein